MKNIFFKIRTFVLAHKIWSSMGLLVLLYGGYREYKNLTSTAGETRYVLAMVTKGTIITTVTGSGQVSASNEVDVKPKASGEIISLPAPEGSDVVQGQVIARLDSTDARKAVRDAEVNLASAELSLKKLQQPADGLSLTQSQNSLERAKTTKQNAEDNLTKTYDDSFNSVSNAFLDLPGVVSGLHDLLFTTNAQLGGTNVNNIDYYSSSAAIFDPRGSSYGKDADSKYQIALTKYNKNFQDYKALNRNADHATIEAMVAETYDTSLAIADAVKSANNLIQFFQDQMTQHNQKVPTLSNTQLSTLNTYTGTTNSHLTDLLGMGTTIKNDKNTITDSTRTIDESTQSLAKLVAGTDPLDLESSRLSLTQRQNALLDAQTALSNYTVRAPFAGTLSKISLKMGDSAGSGNAIATLITKQNTAVLSVNEVDAAKIKVGQKATLTFDAIEDLSISGVISQIDSAGTVSQGVVTYAVKISFDTQDPRVKSGMSVNATIQTEVRTDVLMVASAAIKSQGTSSHYVQMFDTPISPDGGTQGVLSPVTPHNQTVELGITDDTSTEITRGLKEGDQIVLKTTAGIATAAARTTAPSLFGGSGGARTRGF